MNTKGSSQSFAILAAGAPAALCFMLSVLLGLSHFFVWSLVALGAAIGLLIIIPVPGRCEPFEQPIPPARAVRAYLERHPGSSIEEAIRALQVG